jgi:hypothetical protein
MGLIVIPLTILGLSALGISILIALPLYLIADRYTKFESLGENTQAAIILLPSFLLGGFITVQIWLYFQIPLV